METMSGSFRLPYFNPDVPAALPTDEEIESPDEAFSETGRCKAVRVGEHFVVKYGHIIEELEAETMIFIKNNTSIPIPRVYAVYRSEEKRMLYIVMEYIPGNTLLSEWLHLSKIQKDAICLDLKRYLEELRSFPSPGYFGGYGAQHMSDGVFWTGNGDRRNPIINGPFKTECCE
jgi:serine/threonine protein kinase